MNLPNGLQNLFVSKAIKVKCKAEAKIKPRQAKLNSNIYLVLYSVEIWISVAKAETNLTMQRIDTHQHLLIYFSS